MSCSFCARNDNRIQVVCESRCLICSRCIQVGSLKKLLVECYTNRPTRCPICETSLARDFIQTVRCFPELSKPQTDENVGVGQVRVVSDMDFSDEESVFAVFLKRFRQTYGDARGLFPITYGEGDGVDEEAEGQIGAEIVSGNTISSPVATPARTPSRQKDDVANKATSKIADYYGTGPSKLTPQSVLEFSSECYGNLWSIVLRNGTESMQSVVMRLCSKKKNSQRTNDFKAKGLIDFFNTPGATDSPQLLLFGKIAGLPLPKRNGELLRTAWGTVATVVLVTAYCDRCLRNNVLIDFETGQPTAAEFKQKLNKFVVPKVIPLKRAIKILAFLHEVSQPHWTMAPMSSRCMEYNVQLPWIGESQTRLLHLLFFAAGVGDDSLVQRAEKPANSGTRGDGGGGGGMQSMRNSRAASPSPSVAGGGRCSPSGDDSISLGQSSIAGSEDDSITRANSPLTPLMRFMKEKTTAARVGTAGGRRGSTDASLASGARRSSVMSTNLSVSSSVSSLFLREYPGGAGALVMSLARLRSLRSVADVFWSTPVAPSSSSPSSRDVGRVVDGFLNPLNYTEAIRIAGNRMITVSELALVCLDAWDVEYRNIMRAIDRALVSTKRRVAIQSVSDRSQVAMNTVEKATMRKIIEWAKKTKRKGVDWDSFKESADSKSLPFKIPQSLMDRSAGELNFCEEFVRASKVKKELIEKMRDALDLGDMARISYNYRASDEIKRVRTNVLEDGRKALEAIAASGNYFGFRAYRGVLGAGKIAPSVSLGASGSTICVAEDRLLDEELSALLSDLEYSISDEDFTNVPDDQIYNGSQGAAGGGGEGEEGNSTGYMIDGHDPPLDSSQSMMMSNVDEVAILERYFSNTEEGQKLTREQKEALLRQAYMSQTPQRGGYIAMSGGGGGGASSLNNNLSSPLLSAPGDHHMSNKVTFQGDQIGNASLLSGSGEFQSSSVASTKGLFEKYGTGLPYGRRAASPGTSYLVSKTGAPATTGRRRSFEALRGVLPPDEQNTNMTSRLLLEHPSPFRSSASAAALSPLKTTARTPLAAQAYESPNPGSKPLNIVDIMGINPSLLTRVGLLKGNKYVGLEGKGKIFMPERFDEEVFGGQEGDGDDGEKKSESDSDGGDSDNDNSRPRYNKSGQPYDPTKSTGALLAAGGTSSSGAVARLNRATILTTTDMLAVPRPYQAPSKSFGGIRTPAEIYSGALVGSDAVARGKTRVRDRIETTSSVVGGGGYALPPAFLTTTTSGSSGSNAASGSGSGSGKMPPISTSSKPSSFEENAGAVGSRKKISDVSTNVVTTGGTASSDQKAASGVRLPDLLSSSSTEQNNKESISEEGKNSDLKLINKSGTVLDIEEQTGTARGGSGTNRSGRKGNLTIDHSNAKGVLNSRSKGTVAKARSPSYVSMAELADGVSFLQTSNGALGLLTAGGGNGKGRKSGTAGPSDESSDRNGKYSFEAQDEESLKASMELNNFLTMDIDTYERRRNMEQAARSISLRDASISTEEFEFVLGRYFNSWQIKQLQKLDLSTNKLGVDGAAALSARIRHSACCIVHLNMGDNNLGDMGTTKLLTAMVYAGCVATLERLDLPRNNITMSLDSITVLGRFVQLKTLDLSSNFVTMDVLKQSETFTNSICNLTNLESFSLAYNRIQDQGFNSLADLIINDLTKLRLIDLSYCFITGTQSMELVTSIIEDEEQCIEVIIFEGNLFTMEQKKDILCSAEKRQLGFAFEGRKKIAFPIQKRVPTLNSSSAAFAMTR